VVDTCTSRQYPAEYRLEFQHSKQDRSCRRERQEQEQGSLQEEASPEQGEVLHRGVLYPSRTRKPTSRGQDLCRVSGRFPIHMYPADLVSRYTNCWHSANEEHNSGCAWNLIRIEVKQFLNKEPVPSGRTQTAVRLPQYVTHTYEVDSAQVAREPK
jgi:hypothetical protein